MLARSSSRTSSRPVLAALLVIALAVGLPATAFAAATGPFDVSGPASSYS